MRSVKHIKRERARVELEGCVARFDGMKLRAHLDPPTAAVGGFPYPARTCAEWTRPPTESRAMRFGFDPESLKVAK